MDLTYATIPVFGGEHRRLYREAQLAYIISNEANPTNHPIFALGTDLGSSLLQLTVRTTQCTFLPILFSTITLLITYI